MTNSEFSEGAAVKHDIATKEKPTGVCTGCKRTIPLMPDGTIPHHAEITRMCPGSYKTPILKRPSSTDDIARAVAALREGQFWKDRYRARSVYVSSVIGNRVRIYRAERLPASGTFIRAQGYPARCVKAERFVRDFFLIETPTERDYYSPK